METIDPRRDEANYWTNFDPETYLQRYVDFENNTDGRAIFGFRAFHEIFKSLIISSKDDQRRRRLLDIGTGPVPLSVISATPFVQQIYLTDFTPANRQYLHRWLQDVGEQTFSNMFEFVTKLENKGELWTERSTETKSKVAGIFPVDLKQDQILGDHLFPKFDVITSCLCVGCVAENATEMQDIAIKLSKMLQIDGHLVLQGIMGISSYIVGDTKFPYTHFETDVYKKFWENAGFIIESWTEMQGPQPAANTVKENQTNFVMHCIKQ